MSFDMKVMAAVYFSSIMIITSTEATHANGQESYADRYTKLEQVQKRVDDAKTRTEMQKCIGITYGDCISATTGSRVAESWCLGENLSLITSIYGGEVIKHFSKAQQSAENPAADINIKQHLLSRVIEAEKKWDEYRKVQCEMEMTWYGAGNAVATAEPVCHARLYVDRIYQLKHGSLGR